uniref:hypothetical protein n=1 Tax=Pedobacter schmidteae TaxID=2201271 RepID=UPI000EB1397E|nr:hypothetical protein [Pedobacter schmidteae]
MIGNIVSKIIFAAIIGGGMGLFYTVLLNSHGFTKIKYKQVAICVAIIIFLLSFYSFEAAGIATFILGIGVFILALALFARGLADNLKGMSSRLFTKPSHSDNALPSPLQAIGISRYYGLVFHLVVIILISLSIFTYSNNVILDETRMDRLISDAVFQFYSTLLLILLGLFNPFITPSERLMGISSHIDRQKYPRWHAFLSDKRSWTAIKVLICALVIIYFVQKGFFSLPTWDKSTPYMNIYILMIGLFIFINLLQMIRNPDMFFKRNIFRITMLFKSAYLSIFVGAILVFSTMFISSIMGIDIDKLKVSSEAILFLAFNIIMGYNEYKLARI